MCSLSINDFLSKMSGIQAKSSTNPTEAKEELKELLFSEDIYNSSEVSSDDISGKIAALDVEIQELEAEIEAQEKAAEDELKEITNNNEKVATKQKSLEDAIAEAISSTEEANEAAQQELSQKISDAQARAINKYLNGTLDVDPLHPEEAVTSAIQAELAGVASSVCPDLSAAKRAFNNVDSLTREISSLLGIITVQSSTLNSIKSNITSLKSQVSVMKLTKSSYEQIQASQASSADSSKTFDIASMFSSSKTDFLSGLKTLLNIPNKAENAETKIAGADDASKNDQLVAFGEAIDSEGDDSIIKQMADQGLSFEEASKALSWMFEDVGIGFDSESGAMIIPDGDDTEAESIYSSLADQMKQYWGDSVNIDRTSEYSGNSSFLSATANTIGFNLSSANGDDFIYNFVVDYNNDGIFNGENEFLGADKNISSFTDDGVLSDDDKEAIKNMFGDKISFALWGDNLENLSADSLKAFDLDNDGKINNMESLFMLDLNKDGSINGSELDNLMVLETKENSKSTGFMSASMAGISNIDLNKYMSNGAYSSELLENNKMADINGNIKQNTFGMSVKGQSIEGSQKLNSTEYNNYMYSNAYNNNFKLSFDENIFNEIDAETTPEDFEYVDYTEQAVEALEVVTEEARLGKNDQMNLVTLGSTKRRSIAESAEANAYQVAKNVAKPQPEKEEKKPIEGDINNDGKITIEDGDYNEDGVVNSADEEYLQKIEEAKKQQSEE